MATAILDTLSRNSDLILEGAFWGGWCGLNVSKWSEASRELQKAQDLPQDAQKAEKVWAAQKEHILSCFSVASGASMVLSFLHDTRLFPLGLLGAPISAVGFGGSVVVTSSKLIDDLRRLGGGIGDFIQAENSSEKIKIVLTQLELLVEVAFYVTVIAWGVLGVAHSLYGGQPLFLAMDAALYYAVCAFGAWAVSSISLPVLRDHV
jgi:hypothetical protein